MTDYSSKLQSLSPKERAIAMQILNEMKDSGSSSTLNKLYEADFEEIPVDIDTFIESEHYAGWFTNNGKDVYPYWRNELRNIFSDPHKTYQEVAFTGAIGTGKSTAAMLGLSYVLYRLMCLKDPHEYYRLQKGSPIYIVFFNITLELSQGVAYTKFQGILQNSPWFIERGQIVGRKYLEYIPNKPIRFTIGSQMEHSLGRDVFAGIMDEVSFAKGSNVIMEKSKIMSVYNSVLERMGSRFMVDGKLAGCLFLVSSKKAESDFLESYIKRRKGTFGTYIVDAKLWEVKPTGTYSGQVFKVAVGGSNMPSKIIPDDGDPEVYIKQGYDIIDVPVEFKQRFIMDIEAALMNIAGISVSNVTKFITYESLVNCYSDRKNPFTSNILTIGMKDAMQINEFFIPQLVPYDLYTKPIFIHIDTSVTGDKTGIGAVAAMGYKYQNEYNLDTGDYIPTKELVYNNIFAVAIQCPPGSEISFQKTRDFIHYLKHELNWNIKGVSTDGFQSVDTRQMLESAGFDASLVSLDRSPDGYLTFKAAINEKRISIVNIPELEKEIIELVRDNMSGKIDHQVSGSKDIADSVAGALFNASKNSELFSFYLSDSADNIMSVNDGASNISDGQKLLDSMVSQRIDQYSMPDSNLLDLNPESSMTIRDAVNNILAAQKAEMKAVISEVKNEKDEKARLAREQFLLAKKAQTNPSTNLTREQLEDLMDVKNNTIMF